MEALTAGEVGGARGAIFKQVYLRRDERAREAIFK
jgi:hypothetical protein